jgi:hypothetical protein
MLIGTRRARIANIRNAMNIKPIMSPVATTSGTDTRWNCGVPGELNNTSAPMMNDATPGGGQRAVRGRFDIKDEQNEGGDEKDDAEPVNGQHAHAIDASVRQTTPMKPATQPPGLEISISTACTPMAIKQEGNVRIGEEEQELLDETHLSGSSRCPC